MKTEDVHFSILIATKGRESVMRTLETVVDQARPGDELILDLNDCLEKYQDATCA